MSRPIEVRKATTDDVAALAVLWTELAESADLQPSGDSLRRRIESSLDPAGFTTLVAVEESKVVGFVTYTLELTNPLIDSPALRVSGMHVSNDDRRRGVGAALLQAVVTAADEAGATEISVSVPPEMRALRRAGQRAPPGPAS